MALQAKALVKLTGILIFLWLSALNVAMAEVGAGDSGSTGSFDINERSVTIEEGGTYIITGTGEETGNTITVNLKDNGIANITIEGVNIKTGNYVCPFKIIKGTVNLTLEGKDDKLEAGDGYAALQVSENSVLVITEKSTGKLTATGGYSGAGIGGAFNNNAGHITIAGGTVDATGGYGGAGIGGGSSGCSITIKGGTVTAKGKSGGASIGGGMANTAGSIIISGGKVTTEGNIGESGSGATCTISGGTIVCKSFTSDLTISGGSVRTDDNSVIKGMAVVKVPHANAEVKSIKIGEDSSYGSKDVYTDGEGKLYLYIPQDKSGPVTLTIEGIANPLPASREYDITNGPVEITAAGDYAIVGGGKQTGNTITVNLPEAKHVANITIEGVNIGLIGCPFNIKQGTVNLTLAGDGNVLEAGQGFVALQVSENSELVITEKSTGKLTARGGDFGDGIEGDTGSSITIAGGTVEAKGGDYGNGIGGNCSITIAGGNVEATGGHGRAGIGGYYYTITISGGTVTARGGAYGAGIGGDQESKAGSITILGGKVTTTGNIGNGEFGSDATGKISGGTIVCKSISPSLSITGGSVHTQDNSVDKDNKGMAVVKGLPKGEKVKSITINEAPYGSNDVYTDDKGQLYLYITKGGAVPVSITIDDKVYTLHVTLEPIITISGKEVTYNESDHKDKSILIGNNVTFTIDAPDASVIDLTIEKGGKLLTEQQLEVKGRFTVDLKANEQKWITFCSPVPLKLLYPNWATGAGDTNCLFLKSGFTTANDQKWTFEQSIKEDTPYLIGVPTGVAAYTLYAQNVKLPGRKEDISINPPSDFDNNLLFRANTSLTEQKLKDIYVLDVSSQKLVLKTEDYILKPFEAYFVASPATRNMLKTISLLGSDGQPTGIAEVKVQKNTNFKAYSNSPGTLTFENQGEPAAVIVVNALGKGMFVYSNFTGSKHLYGLSAGVYFVRSNKEVKKVIVK